MRRGSNVQQAGGMSSNRENAPMNARKKTVNAKKTAKRPVTFAAKSSPSPWLKMAAAALDNVRANILVADLDLEIIYVNECAKQTLSSIANEIREVFDIEVDDIQGSSIHTFLEDTRRVEKLLANPKALPHQAEFTFGSITLEARINSLQGAADKVLGYVVAWEDVTDRQRLQLDYAGQIAAIQRSQAVVEFEMDGTIIGANQIFLKTVGYALDEVKGRHHSMFVDEGARRSAEYRELWLRLNRGESVVGEFRRIGKNGREIYVHGVYSPIADKQGKPFKVIKYATEVTETKQRNADYQGQVAAISRVQAVIEFGLDGVILRANDNFLDAMGYRLDEVQGRHHNMFVDSAYATSAEYRQFWLDLAAGRQQTGRFRRVGKGG